MHMPLVLSNRRRRGGSASAPAFSPSSLYSSGSQGIWLDPSDLSTMFSDRAGTTPVTTPGTVVGLRLDKSKGLALGAEYVTNAADREFSSSTGFWSHEGGGSISGGVANINNVSGTAAIYRFNFPNTAGGYVEISFDLVLTAGAVNVLYGSTSSQSFTTSGRVTVRMYRSAVGTFGIRATGGGTATGTIDNISVRELPGNHAQAPTDAARPVYGVEPKGGRRNLLTWSEDFTNAVWTFTGSARTLNYGIAPDGTQTSTRIQFSGANQDLRQGAAVGAIGTVSVWIKGVAGETVAPATNLADGLTLVALTGGWQRITRTGPAANATIWFLGTYGGATARDFEIWHPQLETGSTATAYQRVTTAYDVTESGVATTHYVQYDGSDDSMSTAAIDFSGTDKMSVFAGVRKLSDAAVGMLMELSADYNANIGSFHIAAPGSTGAAGNYTAIERGNASTNANQSVASGTLLAPRSDVVVTLGNISGDALKLRINGTQVAQATGDQGTGNFGNYPLFIGRRNNATLPFNGRDYGIIVVGKAASAGEISDTELWLSDKTAEVDVAKSISPNIYTRSGDTILDRANSIIERRTV